ncbi:MAG TPA: hypothetical protein VIK01_00470 [Polyangiaceae bacterium]
MNDSKDPKWLAYLYRNHSFDELVRWTRLMRYFRFHRAIGGHANDGDELLCALRSRDDADVSEIFTELGIPVREVDAQEVDSALRAGRPNRYGANNQWLSRIAQPGTIVISGVSVSVYVRAEQTELSLSGASGDYFQVDELDVHNALRVETAMAGVANRVVLPPRAGEHCFSIP